MKKHLTAFLMIGIMAYAALSFAAPQTPVCYDGWFTLKDKKLTVQWETTWGDVANKADLYSVSSTTPIATLTSSEIVTKPAGGCNGTFVVNNISAESVVFYIVLDSKVRSKEYTATNGGSGPQPGALNINCGYDGDSLPEITRDMTLRDSKGNPIPTNIRITKEPYRGSLHLAGPAFTYVPDNNEVKNDTFGYEAKDNNGKVIVKDGIVNVSYKYFKPMESLEYYRAHVNDFKSSDSSANSWLYYWANSGINGTKDASFSTKLETLAYYIRIKNVDMSKIKEIVSPTNPDNVNRIIKLMPKDKFEAMFPHTAKPNNEVNGFYPGRTFTYLNFLKAAAVMPGYCGNYEDYPINDKTKFMKDPDVVAKKFLATTFAHAVQETSNTGAKDFNLFAKIPGTFGHVREAGSPGRYLDAGGPFGPNGYLNYLTVGNSYFGRGAKQLSYPSNYANVSLLLYGDLRLVKFPQLVEEENVLPFLTAIAYALLPKSSNPSIAEIMDGTWSQKLHDSNAPSSFRETYDRDFPLTVLIVNGGPECNGHTDSDSVDKSKYRIDAYNYFSKDNALLKASVTYEIEDASKNVDYYKVDKLMADVINNIASPDEYKKLFKRPYYYSSDGVVSWDSGIQIFGGKAVKDNIVF